MKPFKINPEECEKSLALANEIMDTLISASLQCDELLYRTNPDKPKPKSKRDSGKSSATL